MNAKDERKGQRALDPNAQNTPDFDGCGPPYIRDPIGGSSQFVMRSGPCSTDSNKDLIIIGMETLTCSNFL